MDKAHPTATPMTAKLKVEKLSSPAVDTQFYQSMLGSVMYAMTGTWPDLAFAIGYFSQHAAMSRNEHLAALKQVYHYLLKTKDASLTFDGMKPGILEGFTDLDWAGNLTD
jgi:hypothetical protein